MNKNIYLIIDFDSTLVKVESLDLLAEIVLGEHKDRDLIVNQIKEITQLGMEGKIEFGESLERRVKLFSPSKKDIEKLVIQLKERISDSVLKNIEFFRKHAANIYVISGGFYEFIAPVVKDLGISNSHILANRFIWEGDTALTFDKENLLSKKGGKVLAVHNLALDGRVIVIGDGFTDYQIRREGEADIFIAYCENISRNTVVEHADFVAKNFNDVLTQIS